MNADGSGQRRLTFGTAGAYAAPDWSPDGKWIAFTQRSAGARRIGIIAADGSDEKILTRGPGDEGPSWAASGREILFQRSDARWPQRHFPPVAGWQRAAPDEHSARRIGPRLVRSGGLMARRFARISVPRGSGRRRHRRSAGRRRPQLSGDRAACARSSRLSQAEAPSIFRSGSHQLTAQARTVLVAQAQVDPPASRTVVRIEGHADGGDTRDHALAVGARRAQEVRDLSGDARRAVGAGDGDELGQGAPRPRPRRDHSGPIGARRRGAGSRWPTSQARAWRWASAISRAVISIAISARHSWPRVAARQRREVEPFVRFDEVDGDAAAAGRISSRQARTRHRRRRASASASRLRSRNSALF